MARETIRNFSLYIDGKKVGTAQSHTYSLNSGNQSHIGDGQWIGTSDGVPTSSISANVIVPYGGKPELDALLNALLNKKYLQVGVGIIGGKIHKLDMKVMTAEYSTDMASGNLTGKFDLIGGQPELVG